MTAQSYDTSTTALLLIDPYNDFLSEAANSGRESRTSQTKSDFSTI